MRETQADGNPTFVFMDRLQPDQEPAKSAPPNAGK
jgi:hypothetical protein